MKHLPLISSFCSTPRRKLYMAIAAQMIASAGAHASPNGGAVVGGDGIIEQSGLDTTIIQNTNHLAIDWQSFNIAAEERVQFIQPDADSVALNRILGNEASQIFGRLDANGHVILMNPNGVLFGEGASVNVGGLVASGLNINADDFMNGDYVLQAVDGKDGTVINKGIINAATGGNIALIGKQVDNQGLISAKLGAVTLAAGKEAVLTFDNQGLLGVRVSKEILQDELGIGAAVSNSGDINAEGGQILMTGSVSQDIFSQAVNAEGLNAKTSVVMHEDGSFTLGAGADVVNTGTISASSETTDAGQIVVLGENVNSSGAILANSKIANAAGNIEIHSRDTTLLTSQSHTSATNEGAGTGGQVKILGDRVGILGQSQINTSGTNGGGDINIGGGFQGKETQLRNATRTVVGKDTLIEANAITDGDGGDVIVWADETTSFTGEINVRGGELGGDGGFVEVSGKENLRFLGNVDRSAVRGENGTLLLDPETITIITAFQNGPAPNDSELDDSRIVMNDSTLEDFVISDAAISAALAGGDVILQATRRVATLNETFGGPEIQIVVADNESTGSLIIESGGAIDLYGIQIDLGAGNLALVAGMSGVCSECVGTSDVSLRQAFIVTSGSLYIAAADQAGFEGHIGRDLNYEQVQSIKDLNVYGGSVSVNLLTDTEILGDVNLSTSTNTEEALIPIEWPSGQIVGLPVVNQSGLDASTVTLGAGIGSAVLNIHGGLRISSTNSGVSTNLSSFLEVSGLNITSFSNNSINLETDGNLYLTNTQISNDSSFVSNVRIKADQSIEFVTLQDRLGDPTSIRTGGGDLTLTAGEINFANNILINSVGTTAGNIDLISQEDIVLPTIVSGGDLNVESTLGSVSFSGVLNVGGDTSLSAAEDIVFLAAGAGESDVPASIFSENGDVQLTARNIDMGSWGENHAPLDIGGSFTVNFSETARIKGILNADEGVEISTQTGMLSLGWGSINTLSSFSAHLANGSYDGGLETGGFMSINAGQIDIIGSELLLADVELNGDSILGTGDINITITGDGEFAYPSINRQRLVTTGNLNIDIQSPGATTLFYGDESSAINVDGTVTISAIGDLIIPDLDVKGDLSATSAQGGITFTKSSFEAPTLSSLVAVEGDVILRAGTDILLTEGSSLNVGGETQITAEDDISFLETSIFLPEEDVYLTSGNDINFAASSDLNDPGIIELAESNPASFIFNAGRNVVIDSTLTLGTGDFVASAGTRAHSPSDFPLAVADANFVVRSHEGPGIYAKAIDTNGRIIFRSAHFIDIPMLESGANGAGGYIGYYTDGSVVLPHYANSNGNFEVFNYSGAENLISTFQLSDGSIIELPSIVSFESSDAGYVGWYGSGTERTLATSGGNFYVQAREIQHWGGNAVDVSSISGHGNITMIAEEEITAPPIIYSNALNQGANQSSEIRLSGSRIRIDRDIDFNNAGVVDFGLEASGEVIIGVIEDDAHYLELSLLDRRVGGSIFDSVGGDTDQLNIQITSGGTVFQKYDMFTGGGNYSATASEFQFNDLVILNTDFANVNEDALFGTGSVSIQSASAQAELVLPGITTQKNCIDTSDCGTLSVSAASVYNEGIISVSGDALFDVDGPLRVSYTDENIANYIGGYLSVNADYATINATGALRLGEWNLLSTENQSVVLMEGREAGSNLTANARMLVAGRIVLGGDHVEVKNSETVFAELLFSANTVDIEYSGDLNLVSAYLFGGENGTSRFAVAGDLTASEDWYISGGIQSDLPILDVDSATPIIFDVAGNIQLLGERNRLSSIQILNAQNVNISNNGDLTLDGVNAESLTLDVLGDVEQTAALNIRGATNINASVGTNINLLDPLNDFNSLSVQSAGPAIINIADVNNISLADIDLNGASQGGALSVRAASITQEDNGSILLQDGTRLNVQADSIAFGANGTATVDINGSVLNGVYANDLSIQGTIRGAEGAAGTGLAGFYFNGSGENNIFEVTEGASIIGDFLEGSNIYMGNGDDVANLSGDVAISIEGGAGQDTFFIEAPNLNIAQILGNEDQDILIGPDGSNLWNITGNGEGALSGESAVVGFSGIESVRGGSQTDNFIVESPDVVVQLDGGDGLDSLSANLNDALVNNQWVVDGVNSGSLNELVLFTSVENLIGNDGADTVTVAESAQIGNVSTGLGDDVFTLNADVITGLLDAGEGQDVLNLNGLDSIYTYLAERIGGDGNYTEINFEIENNEGGSKTIVGVDGYDVEWIIDADGSVTISALQGGTTETNRFTGVTRVEGGSGDDTFILQGGIIAGSIVGGQGGNDTLIGDTGLVNEWSINGVNSGNIWIVETDQTQLFESIANLIGGANDDLFEIATDGSITGSIDGGVGNDRLVISDDTATNNWLLSAESSVGAVTQFQNIENLVGNINNDVFSFSGATDVLTIQGGAGANAVNWADTELVVNLGSGLLNDQIAFEEISVFAADTAFANTLIGSDEVNNWILTAADSGTVSTTSFSGFTTLRGGVGQDTLTGIDADAQWQIGTDSTLTYGAQNIVFTGMEQLTGGAGSDSFIISGVDGGYRLVDSGILRIAGGAGRNQLDVDAIATWEIEQNDGTVRGENDVSELAFSQIQSVGAVVGNFLVNDIDTIVTTYTAESGSINFSGVEGVLIFDVVEPLFTLSGINSITGNGANSTISAANEDAVWRIISSPQDPESEYIGGIFLGESFSQQQNNIGDADFLFYDFGAIAGGDGDDGFAVDTTSLGVFPTIDGGAGANTLIANSGNTLNNTWTIDGVNSGTLNTSVQFSNIQDLQGNDGVDTVTFAADSAINNISTFGGNDLIFMASGVQAGLLDGGLGDNLLNLGDLNTVIDILGSTLEGGDAIYEVINFTPVTDGDGLFTVRGVAGIDAEWLLDGDDSVLIRFTDTEGIAQERRYTNVSRMEGTDGNNRFILTADGSLSGQIVGGTSLTAANDQANTWLIDGADSGTLTSATSQQLVFQGIANLIGGTGADIFEIATGGSITGSINGGIGEDSLTISDVLAFNNWQLGAQSSTELVNQFSGIENLLGNINSDIFNVVGTTEVTSLDGGEGGNILIWSAGDLMLNLDQNTANQSLSFIDIRSFAADGENNTLVGAATDNTWIIGEQFSEGNDDGIGLTGTTIGEGMVNSVFFTGFNNLVGGAGVDTFRGMNANGIWQIGNYDNPNLNTLTYGNQQIVFSGMEILAGGAGADEFSAELVGVTAIDGGLGINQLVSTGAVNNEWSIGGSNSGSFNTNLVFEGIQNLVGNAGNDTFTFAANSSIGNINSGAGEDTFILANNITAGILDGGDGLDILDRGGLNSIVTYLREVIGGDAVYTAANIETETSSGGSTTVVGVDGYSAEWRITGDGTVSVTATDTDGVAVTNEFTGVTRAEGGAGFDAFVLLEEGAIADGIIGNGNDYLQASETTNIWTINAADGGELAVQEFGTRLAFQGIANLYGGNGSDIFEILAGGSISGSIYGSGSVDTLIITDAAAINNWQLDEANSVGLVADFREIETLVGNSNNDTFTFSGATAVTSIDGAAGDNAVIWRADNVAINLGAALMNDTISFAGIDSFDADTAFENTLIGADESNTWTLNGAASGTVATTLGALTFSDFQNLMGGSGSDNFVLTTDASGFANLNGSTGEDTISAADQLNEWVLDTEGGELNGMRFANVETITGGALQDNFVLADASSQAQTIDGGAGDNQLSGYDQINIWNITSDNAGSVTGLANFSNIQTLIGGTDTDTFTLAAGVNLSEIYAGAGNDLFIIGAGVAADNFYGEAGDDSVEVEVGLELSGVLDGGSGGETDGDYINLSKYTLLDATAELESVLGFAFLNFERIDEPNTQGVYFGGDGTNFWYITGANEGRLEIRDGEDAGVYEFSGVHSLLGGEGEDIFIFANDAAAVSTLIDGGEGAGANTLDLSAQELINEWLLSGANSGLVSNASNTSGNIFTNIAYLIGGSNQDVFDLQTGGSIAGAIDGGLGSDELWVSVEQTNNWQLGGVAGHSVTGIASFTNIEGLTGGAGADNFDILAELTDVTQLNGGAGSDAVNFLYEAPVTVDLADGLAAGLRVESVERFTTADARSVFTGVESAAIWTVDGADQGSIQYLRPADGNLINVAFAGFGNLIGGAGGDQFVVAQDGSLSGTLSGGGGRNTVDLQEVVGEIHIATSPDAVIADGLAKMTLADIDQLIGNGRTWLYGASDRSYTWTIDGIRSGQMTSTLVDDSNRLLAFENLSAIRGGTHDDIFQVIAESPLLSLDGGSAVTADLVDYSRVNGNLRISLADALTGQNGELTGVEGIRGNNSGPDSLHSAELAGPDSGAVWSIGSLVGDGLADGVNDGRVAFDEQTITFVDFNVLTGGAGVDTFNQVGGIVLGTLNGGAGDDVFNVDVMGANAGTAVVGGAGTDSLVLRGGDETGLMTYTAAAGGGEFDYSLADVHYKVSHQGVEGLRDRTLAATLDVRGSSAAETFSLANDRFWVNGGDVVEYSSKRDIAVRSGINDIIEIADNLVVENSLTLANGTVIANDPANNSITTGDLILDSNRDVGLSSARLRTSVDNLLVRNSAGDIYLQEQNGVNLAEFNANGVFDLRLLNGDLTNSAPLTAADVVRIIAENGDVTLASANQLRDDVAISGNRVELHNASTLTLVEINAEELYLRTQRGIEGDGPITVGGLTDIDAGGDVLLDFATNDFNQLRVTNAVNLTVVDQNAIELLDINASGTVVVRSTNTVTLNDNVTGANGVDVSSGAGSINQNGTISTNSGSVVVSAGNGEVNLGEDAKIVSNGGSVNINAGAGNVNMGGDTRIAANGGDVNIVAADSVVVAEVVSSGNVNINAGGGSVSDGNGGATNVAAGGLQSSSNTGFGNDDALETNVGNIDITTNTGNVAVSNSGNVTVDNVSTGQGDISLVNQGDVELGGGSVVAENGANGGSVNIDVSQGSVSQSGSTSVPAVKGGGVVVINAPDGAIGEGGGLRVDAPFVEIIAAIKAGDIFVNPGADKIEYFSGSFKFDDQLLAVEPLEDINPAIFANVKSYFFNDISLLLPRDQLYDEDEEE